MKKLFSHWVANRQAGLHLFLGTFSFGLWFMGELLASSVPPGSLLPARLHTAGFWGLFATLLLAFAHAALWGCNRFLVHFRETSHLPARQLTLVSLFGTALILAAAAAFMAVGSMLLPLLWILLKSLFAAGRRAAPANASEEILPDAAFSSPDLTGLLEPGETAAWVRVAEQILFALGGILLAALLLFALYRAVTALFYRLMHRAAWDDDVRITLSPKGQEEAKDNAAKHASGRRRPFFSRARDPSVLIRRRYKKTILAGFSKTGKKALPDSPKIRSHARSFPFSWASPDELEALFGVHDAALHLDYEKARYGADP